MCLGVPEPLRPCLFGRAVPKPEGLVVVHWQVTERQDQRSSLKEVLSRGLENVNEEPTLGPVRVLTVTGTLEVLSA